MEKDWTGTKKSVFKMMGASNHADSERESNDYYATDPKVLELLVKKCELPDVILEPACGSGELSRWLEGIGKKVYSSDIVDRGYGEQKNFFEMLEIPKDCKCILTNPPYKYATEFVLHSLDLLPIGGLVVMFLKTTFLETERRYNEIFRKYPPGLSISLSDVRCVLRTVILKKQGDKVLQSVMLSLSGKKDTEVLA